MRWQTGQGAKRKYGYNKNSMGETMGFFEKKKSADSGSAPSVPVQKREDAAEAAGESQAMPRVGEKLIALGGGSVEAKGLLIKLMGRSAAAEAAQKLLRLLEEKNIKGEAIVKLYKEHAGSGPEAEQIERMNSFLESMQ